MKIGLLCSAGGSAAFTALDFLYNAKVLDPSQVVLVTDRACGAEALAQSTGVSFERIALEDQAEFSEAAAQFFASHDCGVVLLFFTRIVGPALHQAIPCLNIHPSLLPAFSGFGALRRAHEARVRFLGATLHQANYDIDGGPILAQVVCPVSRHQTLEDFHRLSFVQKVYLTLVAFELSSNLSISAPESERVTASSAPALRSPHLIKRFQAFLDDSPEIVMAP